MPSLRVGDRVKLSKAGAGVYRNRRHLITPADRRGTLMWLNKEHLHCRVRWDRPVCRPDSKGVLMYVPFLERA
jgi:hypothetical protein